jgi:hypothetical protein
MANQSISTNIKASDVEALAREISKQMEENFLEALGDLVKLDLIDLKMGDFEIYQIPWVEHEKQFRLAQKIKIKVKGQIKIDQLTDENKALRAQIDILQNTIKGLSYG